MIEIERKFLVKSLDFKKDSFKRTRIIQGFLNTNKHRTVRVRIHGEKGYLTVKGISSTDGLSRFEWEKEIDKNEAELLLKLCGNSIIDKIRYEVIVDGHLFEIDEFFKNNEGLIVAEIELKNKEESFTKPAWLSKEITGVKKYYNSRLSRKPYKTWKH